MHAESDGSGQWRMSASAFAALSQATGGSTNRIARRSRQKRLATSSVLAPTSTSRASGGTHSRLKPSLASSAKSPVPRAAEPMMS